MKKITLVLLLLLFINISFSQNLSTDVINIDSDRTLQFDINTETEIVTMTMVLPDNTWLGIGLANDGIALGEGMGEFKDDAIIGIGLNTGGIVDRSMQGTTAEPNLDSSQDWSEVSNTLAGGFRTIVATRSANTGDEFDYIFLLEEGTLPLIYAFGVAPFMQHAFRDYGFVNATVGEVLSTTEFDITNINIHPNPVSTTLNINAPTQLIDELSVEVYNVLGKKVLQKAITKLDTKISVVNWSNGVYVMKITSTRNNKSITKRFIKI